MKTRSAARNRMIQRGTCVKRKCASRNHGNGNFSAPSLSHLNGTTSVTSKGGHLKKILGML